jgi:hypothetical protein
MSFFRPIINESGTYVPIINKDAEQNTKKKEELSSIEGKLMKIYSLGLVLMLIFLVGCSDRFKDAAAPYLFAGLQTFSDGIVAQSDQVAAPYVQESLQTITTGLIEGLNEHVHPEG